MAQLLESGQAADVRFKVEEEELAAHKFILTARSPVFRSATTSAAQLCCAVRHCTALPCPALCCAVLE